MTDNTKIWIWILFCLGLLGYWQTQIDRAFPGHGNDFAHLYIGATLSAMGEDPYNNDRWYEIAEARGIERFNPYVYPPFTAGLLSPLAALDYQKAQKVWFILNHLFIFLSFLILIGLQRKPTGISTTAILFLFAFSMPLYRTLTAGQLNALLLFLLSLAFLLIIQRWHLWGGIILVIAAMIKVFPVLFLFYFLIRKEWKALMGMVLGGIIILVISTWWVGWEPQMKYLEVCKEMSYGRSTGIQFGFDFQTEPANQSLSALWYRLFTENKSTKGLINVPKFAQILSYASGLAVLAIFLGILFIKCKIPESGMGLSLTLITALLIPSLMWDHYLLLLILPINIIICRSSKPVGCISMVLMSTGIILISMPYNFWSQSFKEGYMILDTSIKLYGTLLIYLVLLMNYFIEKAPRHRILKHEQHR